MVLLIVVITIIVFIIVDFSLRVYFQKRQELKLKKEREQALDIGLKLDFSEEATTLKRVEVREPKARILAVDDEAIILDSFRKILVVAGYSIDTVEKGREALGLIRKHDYDFVFTDLKMPEMDGLEVTKAVKHLRPDIDVIVITGYASIETAVETMKYGAMDYVQKPFTEDELIAFFNKSLIRRKDRLERQMKPTVHLITQSTKESDSKHEFNVPAGIFVSKNHTWVNIEMNGTARIGIDDFARKIISKIDEVDLPKLNKEIKKGELLFSIKKNSHTIDISSPVSGRITLVNTEHIEHPEWIGSKPFELSWMCCLEPSNLSEELHSMKIGADSINWYRKEIDKYSEIVKGIEKEGRGIESSGTGDDKAEKPQTDEKFLREFANAFLLK
ncbi:MAG: sigma-54 dependent DNA-binding response regulator [Candidatus Brocadiaceae bacterium]|nr:sigma-54 dependent DNA-binding response regulator [Candidatus Brocadiaceae bacterium]